MAIDPLQLQAWLAQVQMMNDRRAAKQAGKNQRSQLNLLAQLLGQASERELAANQANEMRYQDILQLLGINRRDQIGMVDQYGQSMVNDANRRWDVNQRNSLSDLSSRGLGGSTVADSIRAVNNRERGAELGRIEDNLLRNRMDVRDRTLHPITGVMERRSDVGPDLNSINSLAGLLGSTGAIGGGLSTVGLGGATPAVTGTGYRNMLTGGIGIGPPSTTLGSTPRPRVSSSFAGMPAPPWLYADQPASPAWRDVANSFAKQGVAGDEGFYPSGSDPTRTNPFSAYFGGTKPIGWADRGANFSIVENWQQPNRGPVVQGRPILGGPMVPGFGPAIGSATPAVTGTGYRGMLDGGIGIGPPRQMPRSSRRPARRPLASQVVTPPSYDYSSPYAYA